MAVRQTIGVPVISLRHNILDPQVRQALDQLSQETTRWLQRIAEAVDTGNGLRGEPTFYADINAKGNRLTQVGIPKDDTDAQLKGLSLGRATLGAKAWDAKNLPIVNLPREVSTQDATASLNQEQVRAMIQSMLRDALDLAFISGTFVVTGTGFVANPTGTARYVILRDLVVLFLPQLSGTSNATTFTLTGMPVVIRPTQTSNHVVVLTDGQNTSTDGYGLLQLTAASTTITMVCPVTSDGSWTSSGSKTLYATTVAYHLA